MNKRLGCWALSLLLAVAMLAAVPFAQGATVLRIGAGGDFPTVGEAFASLGENTGDLTLLLSEDLGEDVYKRQRGEPRGGAGSPGKRGGHHRAWGKT